MKLVKSLVYLFFLAIICFPVLCFGAIISFLIFIDSGFPILFRQQRTGLSGKNFLLYKFRTMQKNAPVLQNRLKKHNEAQGPVFKIYDDPRFTHVGKFLSHTGLDELPQLVNIIKGEMAIVGPRPLPINESKALKPWQKARYNVKPGIISPWVVNGYHSKSFDEWMRSDIIYADQKTLLGDFFLLIRAGLFFLELVLRELKMRLLSVA